MKPKQSEDETNKLPSDKTYEKYLGQWELYREAHNGYTQYLSYEYDLLINRHEKLCEELADKDSELNVLSTKLGNLVSQNSLLVAEIDLLRGAIQFALDQEPQLYGMPRSEAVKFRERRMFSILSQALERD